MEFNAEQLRLLGDSLRDKFINADLDRIPMFASGNKLVNKDKKGNKIHIKNRKSRTCYNKSFLCYKHLFCRSTRQQNSNRYTKFNN